MPGKLLYTPDTLSRAPISTAEERDKVFQTKPEMFAMAAVENLPASAQRLESYKSAQLEDPVCSQVTHHCLQGWLSKHQITSQLSRNLKDVIYYVYLPALYLLSSLYFPGMEFL